jgi:hypothetical protein
MNSILDIIKPIELRVGGHHNTALTGQGCLLNVCSYLAGDEVITDAPKDVDLRARLISAMINDFSSHNTRQLLIPFIPRLLNSAASSDEVKHERFLRLVKFQADFEKDIRRVWSETGSKLAEGTYGMYLRFKMFEMMGEKYIQRDEDQKCKAIGIQFGYGLQWMEAASADAYSRLFSGAFSKIQAEKEFILFKAKICLDEMLPKEAIDETSILQSRAAALVSTAKNYVPGSVKNPFLHVTW